MTSTLIFNPFAPGYATDPYPHLAELRAHDPVHQHPMGFWLLTRHADVSAVLRSGMSVELRNLGDGRLREQRQEAVGEEPQWRGAELSMLDRDPPDHTRLRRLVSRAFTRRAVAAMEARVVELVDAELDRIEAAGEVNLVDALAFPLPFNVISELLGMPPIDHVRLRELAGIVGRSLEPGTDPQLMQSIAAANAELYALTADAIAVKRKNRGEDLLTALIEGEDDGDVLSDDELVAQVVLLYLAGHETTVNLIANGVLGLLRHPDQLALLRSRPDLLPDAIEELVRYDAPVQLSRRITTAPYKLRDREIPAGSFVLACLSAANRDETVFGPDADQLKLDRPDSRNHVSFGMGVHHCLGAVLARLEGRISIGRLVQRFPALRLVGEPTWNGRINLRGMSDLPVAVRQSA